MSLWTGSVITFLLLQIVQPQSQQANEVNRPVIIEEVSAPSEELPRRLFISNKGWNVSQAYVDVFKILSDQNPCSSFYGGPRAATTVLNEFVSHVEAEVLFREISFQMMGKPRLIRDDVAGVVYRLFDKTMVNIDGSFYQRRIDPMRKVPPDVGSFAPGTRVARALILLHELGHLIQGKNGTWLIPDDGRDGTQSRANTLRIQQVCRAQLDALK